MKKFRFPALLLCLALMLSSLPCLLASCSAPAPRLCDVRARLEEVLDAAVDINVVLFGAGLPVYEHDGAEEALIGRYYFLRDDGTELVSDGSRYASQEEIEAALRAVYCKSYADSLCEVLFTGYALGRDADAILAARYAKDDDGRLFQSSAYEPLVSGIRIYDYDSMELDASSNATFLKVHIRFRRDLPDSEWTDTTLTFVPQDGTWYLDGPCY